MRGVRVLFLSILLVGAAAGGAPAQDGFVNPQRDCQTITNCRFSKGGSYRGCISSYSCRVCRFVSAPCRIGSNGRRCQQLRCTWGA